MRWPGVCDREELPGQTKPLMIGGGGTSISVARLPNVLNGRRSAKVTIFSTGTPASQVSVTQLREVNSGTGLKILRREGNGSSQSQLSSSVSTERKRGRNRQDITGDDLRHYDLVGGVCHRDSEEVMPPGPGWATCCSRVRLPVLVDWNCQYS